MGKNHTYTMTNRVLGILTSYSIKNRFAARQVSLKTTVHLSLQEFTGKHYCVKGHGRGITVYNMTAEKILPIIIEALKTAGCHGSWGAEDPPLTTQLLSIIRSFDPTPNKPCCHKCQQPLKVGDKVISLKREHGHHIFHESCYLTTLH